MDDRSFKVLGLNTDATREQVQEAYERKTALYRGAVYEEDPKFAKGKLKELEAAYEEACKAIETAAIREAIAAQAAEEEPKAYINEDPEKYMQQLYHKYLPGRIGRFLSYGRNRSAKQRAADASYKKSVMLFWVGIVALIIVLGYIL